MKVAERQIALLSHDPAPEQKLCAGLRTLRPLPDRFHQGFTAPPFTDNKLITESWARVGMCRDDRGSQVADS